MPKLVSAWAAAAVGWAGESGVVVAAAAGTGGCYSTMMHRVMPHPWKHAYGGAEGSSALGREAEGTVTGYFEARC
jgi:hypothetical protein